MGEYLINRAESFVERRLKTIFKKIEIFGWKGDWKLTILNVKRKWDPR